MIAEGYAHEYTYQNNPYKYMDEFKNLKEKLNNFDYIVTVTKPELSKLSWDGETGRIDAEKIKKYVSNISGSYYFIAGPSVMVSALSEVLKTLNIDRENIKTENFPTLPLSCLMTVQASMTLLPSAFLTRT